MHELAAQHVVYCCHGFYFRSRFPPGTPGPHTVGSLNVFMGTPGIRMTGSTKAQMSSRRADVTAAMVPVSSYAMAAADELVVAMDNSSISQDEPVDLTFKRRSGISQQDAGHARNQGRKRTRQRHNVQENLMGTQPDSYENPMTDNDMWRYHVLSHNTANHARTPSELTRAPRTLAELTARAPESRALTGLTSSNSIGAHQAAGYT